MKQQRKTAASSLTLISASFIVAWLFYFFALWSNLVLSSSNSSYGSKEIFNSFPYLIFFAFLTVAIWTLAAKRKLFRSEDTPQNSSLKKETLTFSNVTIVITLAAATFVAIINFLGELSGYQDNSSVLIRFFNAYVPIILYAALIVTLILMGFVFSGANTSTSQQAVTAELENKNINRTKTGLAYATPIVTIAIALIIGLIVYDLTRAALEVWVWFIIYAIVAAGLILGTIFARQGSLNISSGGATLNRVLTVVFVCVVSLSSLIYTSQAVDNLQLRNSLSIDVVVSNNYGESMSVKADQDDIEVIYVYGDGMESGSTATLQVTSPDADATTVESTIVPSTGYFNLDIDSGLPELTNGMYELEAVALAKSGKEVKISVPFFIHDDSRFEFPNGTSQYHYEDDSSLAKPSLPWIMQDLLPAFLLLLVVIVAINSTIRIRNAEKVGVENVNSAA